MIISTTHALRMMFLHVSNGRELTETEWKKIHNEGGFGRYNIIKIPALQ